MSEHGQSEHDPPITPVELPTVMTAMATERYLKDRLVRGTLKVVWWLDAALNFQISRSTLKQEFATVLISMDLHCPVVLHVDETDPDKKLHRIIILLENTDGQAPEMFTFKTNCSDYTLYIPPLQKMQTSELKPQAGYIRVQPAAELFSEVKVFENQALRLMLNVDDTWIVGIPSNFEFMIVAYTVTDVLIAVQPPPSVCEHIGKPFNYALVFAVPIAKKQYSTESFFRPGFSVNSDWLLTKHPSVISTLSKNVDYEPRGDIFDAVTRHKIIEGRCQAAAAQAKADRTKKLQKSRQREKMSKSLSKRFKAVAIGDNTHIKLNKIIDKADIDEVIARCDFMPSKLRRQWFGLISHVLMKIDEQYLSAFMRQKLRVILQKHVINSWARLVDTHRFQAFEANCSKTLMKRRNTNRWSRLVIKTCPVHFIQTLHTLRKKQRDWKNMTRYLLDRDKAEFQKYEAEYEKVHDYCDQAHTDLQVARWELLFTRLENRSVELLHRDVQHFIAYKVEKFFSWTESVAKTNKTIRLWQQLYTRLRRRRLADACQKLSASKSKWKTRSRALELSVPRCILCFDNFPDIVMMCPSHHQYTCKSCFDHQYANIAHAPQLCPACREPFTHYIQTHVP